MKRALLLGDVVRDFHLMEYPSTVSRDPQRLPWATQLETPGGAAYLKALLGLAGLRLEEIACPAEKRLDQAVQVFNSWKQWPRTVGSKDRVWRMDHITGRSHVAAEGLAAAVSADLAALRKDDLLVIDGLGFGWLETLMAAAPAVRAPLHGPDGPSEIVLKLSSLRAGVPFVGEPQLLEKLTVILPVGALRERGAAISEGLSWDRTIEDTVHEFEAGSSSFDLARCKRVVVTFSAEGAAVLEREEDGSAVSLRKFLFHPSQYEGSFNASHPGLMFGCLSLVTAAVVRHIVQRQEYPLFVALSLALNAIRKLQEEGIAGKTEEQDAPSKRFDFGASARTLCAILTSPDRLNGGQGPGAAPATDDGAAGVDAKDVAARKEADKKALDFLAGHVKPFACAFPHEELDDPCLRDQRSKDPRRMEWSNILQDATGCGRDYVASKAYQIVTDGLDKALGKVPVARYGDFVTADREEIERINAIRKLIVAYLANPADRKPLSIAVFGPPGAGKSFAIKQLSSALGLSEKSIRTFNLSEFQKVEELHVAFHVVRDASVRGEVPLVFWDEFDSRDLDWLKEFLAPMQDAEFRSGSVIHPFGKAIFVFAGGVFESFQDFEMAAGSKKRTASPQTSPGQDPPEGMARIPIGGPPDASRYLGKKASDFISRLRGYLNIKGPNRQPSGDRNDEHLIRRAMLLRSVLERSCKHLFQPDKRPAISAGVVQAFLQVERYWHGARSLESLVTMSNVAGSSYFGAAALPPDSLLELHVAAGDFRHIMRQCALDVPMVELLAEACHEGWRAGKVGYEYGPVRSDVPPLRHPLLVEYARLSEDDKEGNRTTARLTPAKLGQVGLQLATARPDAPAEDLVGEKLDALTRIEHDIWMRDHLLGGYEFAEKTVDVLRLHRCVAPFAVLTKDDKFLDEAIVLALRNALKGSRYRTVRKPSP